MPLTCSDKGHGVKQDGIGMDDQRGGGFEALGEGTHPHLSY